MHTKVTLTHVVKKWIRLTAEIIDGIYKKFGTSKETIMLFYAIISIWTFLIILS